MDFISNIIFLILYFIRPHDWIPGLAGARLVTLAMAGAIIGILTRRQGFKAGDIFRTPLDWFMVAYLMWVVWIAPDRDGAFADVRNLVIFYFVTRLALHNIERLSIYLAWWTGCLVVLAFMASATNFGIDFTQAAGIIESMEGRLALNTWMHNNPNALGHSLVVALPLIYFVMIWKRPMALRIASVPLLIMVCYAVYQTQSKGSYLAGFVTLSVSLLFGRPKIVQIIGITLALMIGVGALSALPRMQEMSSGEEGIVGRLMAWELARNSMQDFPKGTGWKNFSAEYSWYGVWVRKATHSSYVQIGAALGYGGLFLFMAVLFCNLRILMMARTETEEEERARRILFAILFSYCISNWMIDRAYHTEFFITSGAIAAFYQLMLAHKAAERRDQEAINSSESDEQNIRHQIPTPVFAGSAETPQPSSSTSWQSSQSNESDPTPEAIDTSSPNENPWLKRLRRPGLIDLAGAAGLLWLVLYIWDYVLANF